MTISYLLLTILRMAIYYMKLTPTLTPTNEPGADVALADELGFSIKLLGELVSSSY